MVFYFLRIVKTP